MTRHRLGVLLTTLYMAIAAIAGLITGIVLLSLYLSLEYLNGFVIFGLIIDLIMIPLAILSALAAYGAWAGRGWAAMLIKSVTAVRIVLAIFPPGFVGPLGIGILSAPLDGAVLVYSFTKAFRSSAVGASDNAAGPG